MAEKVQRVLDDMVVPLLDLQERGVFDQNEIQAIVTRRRESEYLLYRRNPRKSDYIQYIQSEIQLERLRTLRIKRLHREQKEKQQKENNNKDRKRTKYIGDIHIIKHIHLLWIRTLRKYRSDKELYIQYAQYCKETNSYTQLQKCYQDAIKYHPKYIPFWLEAASHEYFEMGNIQTARILLQRGIRLNNETSTELWIQSFVLELHVIQKLHARKNILLSGNTTTVDNDNIGIGNDTHILTHKDEEDNNNDAADQYKIALIVYNNAIQSKADTIEMRLQFIDQCQLFPYTRHLQDYIMQTIERDYNDNETAWIARATYQMTNNHNDTRKKIDIDDTEHHEIDSDNDDSESSKPKKKRCTEKENTAIEIIQEACGKLQTNEMYLQAIRFLIENFTSHCDTILQLIQQASIDKKLYTPTLVLEHVNYLVSIGNNLENVIKVLENYVNSATNGDKPRPIPARIWSRYAGLLYKSNNSQVAKAVEVLEQALQHIPMHNVDHLTLLIQQLAVRIRSKASPTVLSSTFDRILLLAPGFVDNIDDIEYPIHDDIINISSACLQYIKYSSNKIHIDDNIQTFRKAYDKIIFKSTLLDKLVITKDNNIQTIKAMIDEIIQVELMMTNNNDKNNRDEKKLNILFDSAVRIFQNTPFAADYRQQQYDFKYNNNSGNSFIIRKDPSPLLMDFTIPSIEFNARTFQFDDMEKVYQDSQVVCIRNLGSYMKKNGFGWKDICDIFGRLGDEDRESWCIETNGDARNLVWSDFLSPKATTQDNRAYCSFLIQKDKGTYQNMLERVPFRDFPSSTWQYEPAFWIFFGRNKPYCNKPDSNLDGRPDHTDSVTHDGTWHYQLSGTKHWFLRPTPELVTMFKNKLPKTMVSTDQRVCLECNEGDVIVVNTRLWFHHTIIPPQSKPSVSYARDFRFKAFSFVQAEGGGMKNLDGLYATENIESGTILFTEADMPDCELHRSKSNSNCEVVELDVGINAVVSIRDIKAGEFFCVQESSDEEDRYFSQDERK